MSIVPCDDPSHSIFRTLSLVLYVHLTLTNCEPLGAGTVSNLFL